MSDQPGGQPLSVSGPTVESDVSNVSPAANAAPQPVIAQTKDSRSGGAKARLAIMALLALVALFGTFRGATAEGDDDPIDLAEVAAARADDTVSIDLDDAPAETLDRNNTDLSNTDLNNTEVDNTDLEDVEGADAAEVVVPVVGGAGDGVDVDIEMVSSDEAPVVAGIEDVENIVDEETVSGPAPICIDEEEADHLAPDAADGAFYYDDFGGGRAEWQTLSGDWDVLEGRYVQRDAGGFDRIAELAMEVPLPARISVDFETLEGPLGAGFLLAQPTPGSRNGATTVDFTAEGKFVRWGNYEESTGVYSYNGGVGLADDFDPALPHNFAVDLTAEWTIVRIDGLEIGRFGPVGEGQVGLVTSVSSMAFDNFTITELGN